MKKKRLDEDIRMSPQTFPDTRSGQSSWQTNNRSGGPPTIDILEPYLGQPDIDTAKVYRDELPAADGGYLLPYTLESIYDSMVKIVEGCQESIEMLKNTLSHPSMSSEQKDIIKKQINIYQNISKLTLKNSDKLNDLSIGGK